MPGAAAGCTGRVWTLAERLARCSQEELLQHWLPLPLWMGMVLDALLSDEPGGMAKDIYWGNLFPEAVQSALGSIMQQVQACRRVNSMRVADPDLPDKVRLETASDEPSSSCFKNPQTLYNTVLEGASVSPLASSYHPSTPPPQIASLCVESARVWCTVSMKEVPSKEWLQTYLQDEALIMYEASFWTDAIWSVFSYFSWEEYEDRVSVIVVTITKSVREIALIIVGPRGLRCGAALGGGC
jgi:hypothetical protein